MDEVHNSLHISFRCGTQQSTHLIRHFSSVFVSFAKCHLQRCSSRCFNCVLWDDDERKGEGETRCRLIACSSRIAPRGPPGLTTPIRRTNPYEQYYMPSQHTYCGRVWNLIQACEVQSSPEVENFQISNPGPSEPEADMLPSEPATTNI